MKTDSRRTDKKLTNAILLFSDLIMFGALVHLSRSTELSILILIAIGIAIKMVFAISCGFLVGSVLGIMEALKED